MSLISTKELQWSFLIGRIFNRQQWKMCLSFKDHRISFSGISTCHIWCFFIMLNVSFLSCIEVFDPITLEENQQYVVEGFIEAGDGSAPTFVLLTRSIPFLSEIDRTTLDQLFIRNAEVEVFDGNKEVRLTEICLLDIPEPLREEALRLLNIKPGGDAPNICIYVDIFDELVRREGGSYQLNITVNNRKIQAFTTIPRFVPLESFRWTDPPGEPNDTLARLLVTVEDPSGESNFYRYKTSANGSPLIPPFFSVTDDVFFDGQRFEFPLQKAEARGGDFSNDSFGLFTRGDSVVIKWMTLDREHFDFWNTRDFSANSGGPFASYTRISSNVEGALGIWGGYAVGFYHLEVPEE